MTVDKLSRKVVDVCCYEGSVHDFEVFKNRYPNMNVDSETLIVCDAGYQGIKKYHEKSLTIIKRKPDLELSEYQRKCNKLISKFRVTNEHVIGRLKMWKIIGTKFRHCKCVLERFYEYLKIVSELYNLNID